jgi:F-box/leucine-rich repeat protein 2/20
MAPFLEVAKVLQSFSVEYCQTLNDFTFVNLSKDLPTLKHIKISSCPNISDIGIVAISERCPNLEKFKIHSCQQVTGVGITHVCSQALKLHTLVLGTMESVTNTHLQGLSLVETLQLRSLKIKYCQKITNVGLIWLISNCTQLETLCIQCNTNTYVTERLVRAVATCCPLLKRLVFENEMLGLIPKELLYIVESLRSLRSLQVKIRPFVSPVKMHNTRLKILKANPHLHFSAGSLHR